MSKKDKSMLPEGDPTQQTTEETPDQFSRPVRKLSREQLRQKGFFTGKTLRRGLILLAVALIFFGSFEIVGSGKSGVVVTLGKVSDEILTEGFHFKIPFIQHIVQIDNRTKKIETTGSAASKDLQTVTYEVAVNYKVTNKASASLYRGVGTDYADIVISPAIQESIKASTAQFTAEQLITQRAIVGDMIKETLASKIEGYGITVEVFNIVNFDFSAEFNAAVEAKQTAEQNALKAQQDLARIQIEAQQKVVQAEAEAKSIKLIQETLSSSPEYIDYIKWSKWNGVLPVYVGNGTSIIDLGDIDD